MRWDAVWRLFPGEVIYTWTGQKQMFEIHNAIESCSFEFRQSLVWVKMVTLTRTNYLYAHENCLYFVRKNGKSEFDPRRAKRP